MQMTVTEGLYKAAEDAVERAEAAAEAAGVYKILEGGWRPGLLTPTQEIRLRKMQKEMREKVDLWQASSQHYEALRQAAENAGCITDEDNF